MFNLYDELPIKDTQWTSGLAPEAAAGLVTLMESFRGERDAWQARAEAAENALAKRKSGVYVTEQQMKIAVYDAYVRLFERWNEDSGGYSWAEWLEQRQGESHLATVLENAIDDLFPGVLDIVMAEARTWDKEEVER